MVSRHLAAAALAVVAVPLASTGSAVAAPTLLPAVSKTLTGTARSTYRAPMSGYLSARLAGKGDWDLVLRDAASGRELSASRGFGGSEVGQTWVAAGQRVTAVAVRRRGASRTARLRWRLADVKPPAPPRGTPSLQRVHGTPAQLDALEGLGFDVTENRRAGWADVLVSGTAQLTRLKATGLSFTTRIANLQRSFTRARKADRAYAAAVGSSPLPSGRTGYRTYDDFQSEMKALVADHPGMVRPVVFGKTFQGRELSGIEIADDVGGADGRPVYFLMGNHHAREWPSGEAAMEFAHLLVNSKDDPRIANVLAHERVVILPIVNVDGYLSSRNAFDPGDEAGQDPNVLLAEGVAPPGGLFAYRRKNCDGELAGPELPCELAWGVDNNRNYGNLWGGPGSSADVTSQSYHGPGPRSEPETQAVWNYARTHQVTMLMTLHTVAALVLRPPGLHDGGLSPDEDRMKQLGDAMGAAAGYTSQYSYQLYDTAGTTEDDTYAATGGYGYTIEMGPPDGQFHEPYETGVVKEWTGDNDHAKGQGGLREALLIAAEAAMSTPDHAVVKGTAPAGEVLRLRKTFETKTSPYCTKGIEPVLNLTALPDGGAVCLGAMQGPKTIDDELDSTTTVPASGAFEWHVDQSTRPFVGGGAVIEETKDVDPPLATFTGAPGAPTTTADHAFTVPAGLDPSDKVRVRLDSTLPEDYDLEVFRKEGDTLKSVGSSGNAPGSPEEVLLADPAAGDYVARVTFYAAATGAYDLKVTRVATTRTRTSGTKEAYTLTCEDPDGTVRETHQLVIDRGQQASLALACGGPGGSTANGNPIGDTITGVPQTPGAGAGPTPVAAAPAKAKPRLAIRAVKRTARGLRVTLRCTGAPCAGTLRARAGGRTVARKAYRLKAGRTATVALRLRKGAPRKLTLTAGTARRAVTLRRR